MRILFIVFTFLFSQTLLAQFTLSGQWVGILTNPTQGFEAGFPVLLELDAVQQSAVGIFRLEKGKTGCNMRYLDAMKIKKNLR